MIHCQIFNAYFFTDDKKNRFKQSSDTYNQIENNKKKRKIKNDLNVEQCIYVHTNGETRFALIEYYILKTTKKKELKERID